MSKHNLLVAQTLLWIIAISPAAAWSAQANPPDPNIEQILSYHSDITVHPDSTLLVRETISVNAMGRQIRHGIYRDFPTRYQDRLGNAYEVHFQVVSVQRDGETDDYHLEKLSNGLRIYMGKSRVMVPAGPHTYELTYSVNRELGLFPDHDELYWNVTSNGWVFPIEEASSTVHLPPGIAHDAIFLDAYTGPQGSAANETTSGVDPQNLAGFHTTRALGAHEGLTIVVRWPKGFVRPPTDDEKFQYFLDDNRAVFIGISGLLLALLYYTAVWFMVGRDPEKGVIMPRYEPPRGFSPAAIRYVNRMAFDRKAMAANLVDLAVKKRVQIHEHSSGGYTLVRLHPTPPATGPTSGAASAEVTPDENLIIEKLFAEGARIGLDPANHTLVGGTIEALFQKLRSGLEKVYFITNARYLVPGLLISIATAIWCGLAIPGERRFIAIFLTVWLTLWSIACAALGSAAVSGWKNAFSDPHHAAGARKLAVVSTLFALPFFGFEIAAFCVLVWAASPLVVLILILLVLINYLFHYLLKAPTRAGRDLMDQIEGFRMFLAAVEGDRYRSLAASDMTSAMFEKFLPYAMALNVEKAWSDRFATVLAKATQSGTAGYAPAWYSGPNWNPITATAFATTFGGSFAGAISSASTAPGSSSGGGGGGSSGGGGGGGGGGGW